MVSYYNNFSIGFIGKILEVFAIKLQFYFTRTNLRGNREIEADELTKDYNAQI